MIRAFSKVSEATPEVERTNMVCQERRRPRQGSVLVQTLVRTTIFKPSVLLLPEGVCTSVS